MTNSSSLFNMALWLSFVAGILTACGRKEPPRAPEGSIIISPYNYPKAVDSESCYNN